MSLILPVQIDAERFATDLLEQHHSANYVPDWTL